MLQQMPPIPGNNGARKLPAKPLINPMLGPPIAGKPQQTGLGLMTQNGQAPMPTVPATPMRSAMATPMASSLGQPANRSPSMMPANTGTNHGNMRYGTDNAPPGGTRPPIGGNVNPEWAPQDGISPFNASSGATGIGDFQRFSDNAYNESVRRLDPQFEAQQRSFEQDMVNRGISPGTEAYDNARANFEQSRNDAYATARAAADQQGLAAQQQSFGQGLASSTLLNQLLQARMGANASMYGANAAASASRYGSDQAAQTAANRLGLDREQSDNDFLLRLLGLGQTGNAQTNSGINQNNNAQNQWFAQNGSLLGLFGGGNAPGSIDVSGPFANQYNAGLNQAMWQQQRNDANNQAWMQLAGSMLCDRNAKDEIDTVDPQDALKAISSIPLVCWTYKADAAKVPHVGTYAQDFNAALGLPEDTKISTIDLLGALIGSVQALQAKVKELEAA